MSSIARVKSQQSDRCKPATKKEIEYCKQLEALLLKMPKGLWLYNTGSMFVMKNPVSGLQNGSGDSGDGVNRDNVIYRMKSRIISDGGDW